MTLQHTILPTAVAVAALSFAAVMAAPALAQIKEQTVTVGGAPMYPSKNIIQNAVNSKDHTTLVAAVKAAGLVDTLEGPGPFTVFAPVNAAFEALPAGTVDGLLKPDMKDTLVKVLTYHVVAGKYLAADLMMKAKAMGGEVTLTTVEGAPIPIRLKGKHLWVFDQSGNAARITIADVNQSNGVIHVIDKVLMMKM